MTKKERKPQKMKRSDKKLNHLANLMIEKIQMYGSSDTKVVFMGLSTYPNTAHMFNWDIVYLYKCVQRAGAITRIHDPHIQGPQGLSAGLWLGRREQGEAWLHSYDCIILSCPHVFYMTNLQQLGHLLKDTKPCLFLDLYGALSKITSIGESIDIVKFGEEAKKAELIGGLIPMNIKRRIE